MEEPSKKRVREESEWTEGISSKYKRKYWFNNITGKSVWEDPQTSQTSEVLITNNTFICHLGVCISASHRLIVVK